MAQDTPTRDTDRPVAQGPVYEGECPACGTLVRYVDYHPGIFLCGDCGGEKPHADGVYEKDGHLYYDEDR